LWFEGFRKKVLSVPFQFRMALVTEKSRNSAVDIETGYGQDDSEMGARVPAGARFLSCPRHLDWLWGPLSLLSNGYRSLFPRG
jgi:hypothetical protein